jgi:hypothetical protein
VSAVERKQEWALAWGLHLPKVDSARLIAFSEFEDRSWPDIQLSILKARSLKYLLRVSSPTKSGFLDATSSKTPSWRRMCQHRGHRPIPAPTSANARAASYMSISMSRSRARVSASVRPATPPPLTPEKDCQPLREASAWRQHSHDRDAELGLRDAVHGS